MTLAFTRTLLAPVLIAVAIAPFALSANAAPGGEGGHQGGSEEQRSPRQETLQRRLVALVDSWGLSDEERGALREAREKSYADRQALRERDFDSRQERREAMRELREGHQEALSEILSDEQIEEMRAIVSRHNRQGQGGNNRQPDSNAE